MRPQPSSGWQQACLWACCCDQLLLVTCQTAVLQPSFRPFALPCCRNMYQKFKTAAEGELKLAELKAEATPPPEEEMTAAEAEVKLEEFKAEATPPPEKEMTPADGDGSAQ